MKFRGKERVRVLLKGESWLTPVSFKMFMRRVNGVAKYKHKVYESIDAGFIDTWFVEKGYAIKDISFIEGNREYSIDEYSKKTGIPIKNALQKQWNKAVEIINDRNIEREKEKKIKLTGLGALFGQ